jgi:hypothetical protein
LLCNIRVISGFLRRFARAFLVFAVKNVTAGFASDGFCPDRTIRICYGISARDKFLPPRRYLQALKDSVYYQRYLPSSDVRAVTGGPFRVLLSVVSRTSAPPFLAGVLRF